MAERGAWPQDLNVRNRVYGNFRDPFWRPTSFHIRRAKREGNSLEHLALVRQLWCTLGLPSDRGNGPIQAHHLCGGPARHDRGLGRKSADRWCVPLSLIIHEEVQRAGSRNEEDIFRTRAGVDPYALAIAFWSATGNLPLMARILEAHQHEGRRLLRRAAR